MCVCVCDRFFHHNLTGPEAEQRMLSFSSSAGTDLDTSGTFLVRPSLREPDCFVLSIVVNKKVKILHVRITYQVGLHSTNRILSLC